MDIDERFPVGMKNAVATTTGKDVPVTILGHHDADTAIVRFDAADKSRGIHRGEVHTVNTFLLVQG